MHPKRSNQECHCGNIFIINVSVCFNFGYWYEYFSVYPEKLGQKTKYSQFQNGIIIPRQVHNNFSAKLMQEVKLIIMWTSSGIDVLPGLSKDFQPNHFVPLVEFKAKTGSKQPKITTIFKANSSKKESYLKVNIVYMCNFPQ